MRIAKFISHSGYCSRRDAEKLIVKNKVKLNYYICNNPATNVSINDKIIINNKIIKINNKIRIWLVYKPIGIITSSKDYRGRKTIFEIIPKSLSKIISVGRLDINSEGLIIMTNNGDLARYFELPKSEFKRIYKVRVQGKVDSVSLAKLSKGITIEGTKYKAIRAKLEKQMNSNAWIIMELKEGKNREIRKICKHLGWRVNKLIRIQFGQFNIGKLKPGEIIELKNHPYNDKNYWR